LRYTLEYCGELLTFAKPKLRLNDIRHLLRERRMSTGPEITTTVPIEHEQLGISIIYWKHGQLAPESIDFDSDKEFDDRS
jgi:hypothetical protein